MCEAGHGACEYVVVCIDDQPETLAAMRRDVAQICGPGIRVEACTDAREALTLVDKFRAPDVRVPLIITEHALPGMTGVDLLLALQEKADFRATRKVLASARVNVADLSRALNRGALHRIITKPWSHGELRDCIRALLTSYFIHHAPDELDRFSELVDSAQFPRAHNAARQNRQELDLQVETLKRSFLANTDMTDEQVEKAMEAAIDQALGNPARRHFAPGSVLVRQDNPVDTIFILLSGKVQLSRKTETGEAILHTHSSGRVVGLLSLAHRQRAFYTCRAVTNIVVLPLSLEQLEAALQANARLSGYFVSTLIRSLAARSKHTAHLTIEVETLNGQLRTERDQLCDALDQLGCAQARLVQSEKMATLGQITAGIAHELNNPVAAIQRSADFIVQDITSFVMELPDGETARGALEHGLTDTPTSTRELRSRSSVLTGVVGDTALARRLVKLGVATPGAYHERFGALSAPERERLLTVTERYHEMGESLRNLRTCSDRIAGIVRSLKSYSHSDADLLGSVDVHEGLEDTLRLLDHALQDIHVKRSYSELPCIECRAGELNQVWTNLISNAVQAMGGGGTLHVQTDAPDPNHVRVRIVDSGKGITPDMRDRVFDLHFTTKGGRVEFGLGMGLPICKQIVTAHGGQITVDSRPGETCFAVVLPTRSPRTCEDGSRS